MDNRLRDVQVEYPRAGAAVAVFTGEHDVSTSAHIGNLLGSLVDENALVILDFSEAEFVDSSIIVTLLQAHGAALEQGTTFRLQLGTEAIVERAFEITAVLKLLECVATREEALIDEGIRSV